MPQLQFTAGELTINSSLEEVGGFTSPSTGRQLQMFQVRFRAFDDQESESVNAFLRTGQHAEISANGQPNKYAISAKSSHFTSGRPGTTFVWELRELEQLELSSLVLHDLELAAEQYKEEFDNVGVMTASCVVTLTTDEEERLRGLPQYFNVVRKGISDTPREMRFGRLLWAEKDGGFRMQLILVDKAHDNKKRGAPFTEPSETNVAIWAALGTLRLSSLIDLLVRKGVISAEEADCVRAVEDAPLERQLDKRYRVHDLDEWLERAE